MLKYFGIATLVSPAGIYRFQLLHYMIIDKIFMLACGQLLFKIKETGDYFISVQFCVSVGVSLLELLV